MAKAPKKKQNQQEYLDGAKKRDDALKRALGMPPQPKPAKKKAKKK